GVYGTFVCPEALLELSRLQGGAVALTGFFGKEAEPEIVGFVQTGDSTFFGITTRFIVTVAEMHVVGEAEGVAIYPSRHQVFAPAPCGGAAPAPMFREEGPAIAMMPGLIIMGSTADSVREVVRRAKGKNADPTLASVRAFREAARLRDRPGLFGYADVGA